MSLCFYIHAPITLAVVWPRRETDCHLRTSLNQLNGAGFPNKVNATTTIKDIHVKDPQTEVFLSGIRFKIQIIFLYSVGNVSAKPILLNHLFNRSLKYRRICSTAFDMWVYYQGTKIANYLLLGSLISMKDKNILGQLMFYWMLI